MASRLTSINPLSYLYLAIPFSLYFELKHSEVPLFFAACLAIIPLAGLMGKATEELAFYFGPRIGGFLNATFGNATELIITIFALKKGLFEVIKASLAGSILGNILLVLGIAMLAGGLRNGTQCFHRQNTTNQTSLMFLAIIALVIPATFFQKADPSRTYKLHELSLIIAGLLFVLYLISAISSLRGNDPLGVQHEETHEPAWSQTKALLMLLLSTVLVAIEAEFLVASIEPVTEALHWSNFFVGIVIIPIIGNAAEHSTAVLMALKNKMNIAVEIAIGSSSQIALLVTPLLVFLSFLLGNPMDLFFNYYEIIALTSAVLIAIFISLDGESNWLEGAQLTVAYLIIAAAFYFI